MDTNTTAIILSVIGVGATVGVGLATLFIVSIGRLGNRMTAVEREVARIVGLPEGLGLTGKLQPNHQSPSTRPRVHG